MGDRSAAMVGAVRSGRGSVRGHSYPPRHESRRAPPIRGSSDSPSALSVLFSNNGHVPSALAEPGQVLASIRAGVSGHRLAAVVLVAPSSRLAVVRATADAALGVLPDRPLRRVAL